MWRLSFMPWPEIFFLSWDFLNPDFSVETLTHQDFCLDCWDASWLSRFVEIYQDTSRFVQKSWHYQNFWISTLLKFLDLDFIKILRSRQISQSWLRLFGLDIVKISRLSRQNFWKCQDFLDCRDELFDDVEIETLDQDTINTNWDPQA